MSPLRALLALVILGLLLFLLLLPLGPFRFTSVCTQCGVAQETTEWQIPLSSVTIFRYSSQRPTPVNAELNREGLVSAHQHHWMFAYGSGNGVTCALGRGHHLLPALQSKDVATVLAASHKYGEEAFHDQLVHRLFQPDTSFATPGLATSPPDAGFENASAFHQWLREETNLFQLLTTSYKGQP